MNFSRFGIHWRGWDLGLGIFRPTGSLRRGCVELGRPATAHQTAQSGLKKTAQSEEGMNQPLQNQFKKEEEEEEDRTKYRVITSTIQKT